MFEKNSAVEFSTPLNPTQPPILFFGEQDSRHHGTLIWPGVHNYPLKGDKVLLSKEETAQVRLIAEPYERMFDLDDSTDAADYAWVRKRIRMGWFTLEHIARYTQPRDNQPPHLFVYLEWSQLYSTIPPQVLKYASLTGRENFHVGQ